jgi:hypothetical protein
MLGTTSRLMTATIVLGAAALVTGSPAEGQTITEIHEVQVSHPDGSSLWTVGWSSTFWIVDLNGGALMDNDPVHLQTPDGYYFYVNGSSIYLTTDEYWATTFNIRNNDCESVPISIGTTPISFAGMYGNYISNEFGSLAMTPYNSYTSSWLMVYVVPPPVYAGNYCCNWTCVAWQMIGSVKGKCLRKRGTNCLADVSSNQCGRLGRERIDCTGETSGGDFDHFNGYVEDCTPG